jgi:hypothetical protein
MGICLEMVIAYLFLFLAFTVDLEEAQSTACNESRCGHHGPPIRFPFRLNSQPEHCGYPGFNLSCVDTKHTVLELPISVKLFVKKIDYKSQVIHLYDQHHCLPRQLQGLDLNHSSPFQFKERETYTTLSDYTLFNCSPRPREETDYSYLISCLSGPTYQVYESYVIDPFLISCTKKYTLRSIPYGIIEDHDKFVQLNWSTPACGHCEGKGMRCMKSNSSGWGTQCYIPIQTKGILSIRLITTFVLNE